MQPERLIVAAARLFNTRGYSAVAIEDIGAAVGISGPAIYHHFESKADLLNEIIRRNEQWIGHYISRACAEGESPDDSLVRLMGYPSRSSTGVPISRGPPSPRLATCPTSRPNAIAGSIATVSSAGLAFSRPLTPKSRKTKRAFKFRPSRRLIIDAARNPQLVQRPDFIRVLNEIGNRIAFAQTLTLV